MEKETLLNRIAEVQKMSSQELKKLWLDLFEKAPPSFNRNFLIARIIYRLQEIIFGGLSNETLAKLKKLQQTSQNNKNNENNKFCRPVTRPAVGTVLIREFKNIEHRVLVLSDSFEYQGMRFRSLSAVARRIAGCSWNGLKFFGLKNTKG